MDLTETIAPKSDQLNAEDLLTGPRTFTIEKVNAGSAEQPVNVHLVELPGRPYRPSKSMRRLMVHAWGKEASAYAGRRLTLYRNPDITFGRDKVGGIEISHVSHIDKPVTVALTVTRGKRKNFSVTPLKEAAPPQPASVSRGEIPDEVKANTAKAKQAGNLQDYFAWLTEQGAPARILNYVTAEMPEDPATPQGHASKTSNHTRAPNAAISTSRHIPKPDSRKSDNQCPKKPPTKRPSRRSPSKSTSRTALFYMPPLPRSKA